jgi:hypothetical protein
LIERKLSRIQRVSIYASLSNCRNCHPARRLVFRLVVLSSAQAARGFDGTQEAGGWLAMTELVIVACIAVLVLGLAFYQSHQDKRKWKRITARKKEPRIK